MIPSDYERRTSTNEKDPGNIRNIMTKYGTTKLEELTKYKRTSVRLTIRRARYKRALFECQMKIISDYEGKNIIVWPTKFNLGGVYSGVCLL